MNQQKEAGKAKSKAKTEAARRNARLPRGKRKELPEFDDRKLAKLLLMEIETMQSTIYGDDLKEGELRVNGWPISEIARRLLG